MELSKHGHACVRLRDGDRTLVIDPGAFSDAGTALDGVADVLITHEHVDHVVPESFAGRAVNVYAPESVVALLAEAGITATAVAPGDAFEAGGFHVDVVGGMHAVIHPDIPRIANVGYLIEGIYHPGDSYFIPSEPVTTLLLPVYAPWMKISEAVDFTRAVRPERAYPIHDALLTDDGLALADRLVTNLGGTAYERIANGSSVKL